MAGGDNPLADIYNAAALPSMLNPNPYSAFNGSPLALQGYVGAPTDAKGNPIQSYLDAQAQQGAVQPQAAGTTLNSQPAAAGLQPANVPQGMSQPGMGAPSVQGGLQAWGAATPAQRVAAMPQAVYGGGGNADKGSFGGLGPIGFVQGSGIQGQGQAAPAPQASSSGPDMRQAYLTALSNPGHVTTPGANVPQAPSAGQMPNVLDSFLASNAQPSAPGAGGYSNAPFFNTLKTLRSGAPA
jgi:hypothetical protein